MTHLLLGLLLALATPDARHPWELSVDERIALRANAELAAERAGVARQLQATAKTKSSAWVDDFNGKTHPELFLPHEVFRELVELVYTGPPRANQIIYDGFMPDVKRHGLPPDFWERLQVITAAYVSDIHAVRDNLHSLRGQSGRARERTQAILKLKNADECRSRADALAAARKEFGSERFDRFMYEVIVAGMFHSEDRVADAAILRRMEGGCRDDLRQSASAVRLMVDTND